MKSIINVEIRPNVYFDTLVMMWVQKYLRAMGGMRDIGVVIDTDANKAMLADHHLSFR